MFTPDDGSPCYCLMCLCGWRSTLQQLNMIDQCIYHAGYFRYGCMTVLKERGFREDTFSKFHDETFRYFKEYQDKISFRNQRLQLMIAMENDFLFP